jgi:hypothetical protein
MPGSLFPPPRWSASRWVCRYFYIFAKFNWSGAAQKQTLRSQETAALNSGGRLASCGKLKEALRELQPMEPNSIVVVSLHSPKEKIWGILLSLNPSGITIRGIDLNSFDHFVSQINQLDAERVGLPTVFFPMTRVERVSLDEPSGSIPSMADVFQRKIGRSLFDYLAQFA